MTGHSDDVPTPEADPLDALSRAAANGVSRRQLVRLGGALALGAVAPRWLIPKGAVETADAVKVSGTCTPTAKKGPCGGVRAPWAPACRYSVPNGKTSKFNGCGPQSGLDLPLLGHGDFVPDRPLGVANFYGPCKGHDCCYGRCGSKKAQCDSEFLSALRRTCLSFSPADLVPPFGQFRILTCLNLANVYYTAVSSTQSGMDAYNAGQKEMCDCCEAYTLHFSSTIVLTPPPDVDGLFRFTYTADVPLMTPEDGSAVTSGAAHGAVVNPTGYIKTEDTDWTLVGVTAKDIRVVNFDPAVDGGMPTVELQTGGLVEDFRVTGPGILPYSLQSALWMAGFTDGHPEVITGQPATFVLQPGTTTPNGGTYTVAQGTFDRGPANFGSNMEGLLTDWQVTEHTEISVIANAEG